MFSIVLWVTFAAESSCGVLRQQRQHRRLGRGVAADGDREEPGEGEDRPAGAPSAATAAAAASTAAIAIGCCRSGPRAGRSGR